MEFKQHVKGVLIAILSATVLLFVVSFFVGDEVRVSKTYVIKAPADSVYSFISNPENFKGIIAGSDDFKISFLKKGIGVQYEGYDSKLHTFRYKTFDNQLGLELIYIREEEEEAVFRYKLNPKENGSLLEYEKVWRIGGNPVTKMLSLGLDEDIEAGMKKDIDKIKKELK